MVNIIVMVVYIAAVTSCGLVTNIMSTPIKSIQWSNIVNLNFELLGINFYHHLSLLTRAAHLIILLVKNPSTVKQFPLPHRPYPFWLPWFFLCYDFPCLECPSSCPTAVLCAPCAPNKILLIYQDPAPKLPQLWKFCHYAQGRQN